MFSQDFKVEGGTWTVGVALGPEGVREVSPPPSPENFEVFNSRRCILLHFEATNSRYHAEEITWSIYCKKPLPENWAYSSRRLTLWLDDVYHIMRLLLLNASQVSLFVWLVNLFVVGTSFIQRFIYFRNLPELKLASQMGKLPSK